MMDARLDHTFIFAGIVKKSYWETGSCLYVAMVIVIIFQLKYHFIIVSNINL
jgi:hypothetical protein